MLVDLWLFAILASFFVVRVLHSKVGERVLAMITKRHLP